MARINESQRCCAKVGRWTAHQRIASFPRTLFRDREGHMYDYETNQASGITFNVDEDPGVVEPFLKEHGYEFPVLLAHNVVFDAELEGIPQNWIVDAKGTRQWKQMGFSDDQNWETTVLAKLEAAKTTD